MACDQPGSARGFLKAQSSSDEPLGRILLDKGWLEEDILAEAVAFQSGLEMISVREDEIMSAYERFRPAFCFRFRVLPVAETAGDRLALATAFPLSSQALRTIADQLGYQPRQFIVLDRVIAAGLHLLAARYREDGGEHATGEGVPLLGEILVNEGLISNAALQAALAVYDPQRDGQIGAYLVSHDLVFKSAVDKALEEQRKRMKKWVHDNTAKAENRGEAPA